MGAIPNRLVGFQDIHDPDVRARFDLAWGSKIPPEYGKHLSDMFVAMGEHELTALYVIGENPAQSEADVSHAVALLEGLDHLVVQDMFLTRTAQLATVVLPATAGWCEADGTVTSSERRVQRVRKALEPPDGARDDIEIIVALARRLGRDWSYSGAEAVWDEVRSLSPMHAGMSYARLEALGGIQWPCPSEDALEPTFLHGRLWADDASERGTPAPFSVVIPELPVDELTAEFPLRLTTGRQLDSYNTGVQSSGYRSPLRARGEALALSPEDALSYGVVVGESVRVVSRRGTVVAPVDIDAGLRPGLAFMAIHFPDEVDVNQLTIEAVDPKSGTSEFKATAIRVEPIRVAADA
jgi:predicted molibdopterin-dependent oxidoreductase YjgC